MKTTLKTKPTLSTDDPAVAPKLVAETDAAGEVMHVWLSMPDWRFARPVGSERGLARLNRTLVARAEVHGASRSAVSAWLHQKGHVRA